MFRFEEPPKSRAGNAEVHIPVKTAWKAMAAGMAGEWLALHGIISYLSRLPGAERCRFYVVSGRSYFSKRGRITVDTTSMEGRYG